MHKSGPVFSEHDLIEGCKQDNSVCQQIVYERYYPKMMGVCLRYAADRDQARDMVHEGFIRIFLNIKKFRQESSLETWMSRIMVNCAVDMLRKEMRNALYRSAEIEDYSDDADSLAPAEEFEPAEEQVQSEEVIELIQQLPEGYRAVLNLYAIEQFTHKEIAEKLGISEGTSKSQLAKARQYLKKLLSKKKSLIHER